jgi:hypothetical protein
MHLYLPKATLQTLKIKLVDSYNWQTGITINDDFIYQLL